MMILSYEGLALVTISKEGLPSGAAPRDDDDADYEIKYTEAGPEAEFGQGKWRREKKVGV